MIADDSTKPQKAKSPAPKAEVVVAEAKSVRKSKPSAKGADKRRKVGRPPRISKEKIISTSLELLSERSVEEFTLAKLANRLGTVSMALYNYFPSREVLLLNCADYIAEQFSMPERKGDVDWRVTLRDWIWTLWSLGRTYPILFRLAGVNRKTSAGWLRITRVIAQMLYDLGFRGRELAMVNWLVALHSHSLVHSQVFEGGFHSAASISTLSELSPEEQSIFLVMKDAYTEGMSSEDIIDEGVKDLITIVESRLVGMSRDPSSPKNKNR